MKFKVFLSVLLLAAFAVGISHAQPVILVVSDSDVPDEAVGDDRDDSLVKFLESLNYLVDTSGAAESLTNRITGCALETPTANAAKINIDNNTLNFILESSNLVS